jgi:signal transduction histidine kinase
MIGLVIAQLLSAYVLLRDRGQVFYQSIQTDLIQRTVRLVGVLESITRPERERLIPLLSTSDTRVALLNELVESEVEGDSDDHVATNLVRTQLSRQLPDREIKVALQGELLSGPMANMHRRRMGNWGMPGPMAYMHGLHTAARVFHIQVSLRDGTWLLFQRQLPESLFNWPVRVLVILGILLASVIVVSLLAVHWSVKPLRNLRQAAEALGKNIHREPLPVEGPVEVAETASAFNTMQQRLRSFINDRARILAAVSHDLKTPLTRMRLRSDLLDDESLRTKLQSDLSDMEAMVSATLDFMRGAESNEATQPINLMALLESIKENGIESGWDITLEGDVTGPYQGRPVALKRCIGNLVENAVRYGKCAHIVVSDDTVEVVISITDEGPGIPEDKMEQVFEPFYRLDGSRSKQGGGSGLGLGIARNIARAHGGELTLANETQGGVSARLTLPR